MNDLWRYKFAPGTASYSVHPEKLLQIFKARDARSVCNLITSDDYMNRINVDLHRRIFNNEHILTSSGIRHVISCAQPDRKRKRRNKKRKKSFSESELDKYKTNLNKKTKIASDMHSAIDERKQYPENKPWVPIGRFLNTVEPKSPAKTVQKAIRYKIRSAPYVFLPTSAEIEPKKKKKASKLEEVVNERKIPSGTKLAKRIRRDEIQMARPNRYKRRVNTARSKDEEEEEEEEERDLERSYRSELSCDIKSLKAKMASRKRRLYARDKDEEEEEEEEKDLERSYQSDTSSIIRPRRAKRFRTFDTGSYNEEKVNNMSLKSINESIDAGKSLSETSIPNTIRLSDVALAKATRHQNQNKYEATPTEREESTTISDKEIIDPKPQRQGYYPFGYPGYFTVSASRQAFDAFQAKSKAAIHMKRNRLGPTKNLVLDDVSQAVEGKKDSNGYWSSFENRWKQIREQMKPSVIEPPPASSPSIESEATDAGVSYRTESAVGTIDDAAIPPISEKPLYFADRSAIVMKEPPKPKKRRRKTLLVDNILILFNRVKLGRHLLRLPKTTPEGHRVVLYSVRDNDPTKMNFADCIKTFCMFNDIVLSEDGLEEGYIVMFDMKGVQLGHLARVSLPALRCFFHYIQEAHPVRIKGIHVLNTASWIHHVMRIVIPLVKSELLNMVKFNKGNVPEGFPLEVMPMDYGGETSSIEDLDKVTDQMWEKYRQWLLDNEELKSDETKRTVKKSSWWGFGLFGTRNNEELDEKTIIKNLRYE